MRLIMTLTLALWPMAAAAQDFIDRLGGYDVVILGEVHDNPHHHRLQAQAISALRPTAVVFEMLSPEQAARVAGTAPSDLAEVLAWAESGWPPFELYAPIFAALGDARAVGAAVPRADMRQAFMDGAVAVFGAEAGAYGLDQTLAEEEQSTREDRQFTAHCEAMPRGMMANMVEAQRLRDAVFARATRNALAAHGGPVVLVTGSGHADTAWGVPVYLRAAAPDLRFISVGFTEGGDGGVFDIRVPTPAPENRPDPCAAFRSSD
ncbi:MAG: ChaN family lipoprotein [Pseudomonadota bacterium]